MKKSIIALAIASSIALLPLGAHATTTVDNGDGSCTITVASGESATINYATTCNIINNGSLTVANGANITNAIAGKSNIENNGTLTIVGGNIVKTSRRDSTAPITNNGTLTMNAGYLEGDYGIMHLGGKVVVNGGTIRAWLYPTVWAKNSSPVYLNGGTFKFPVDWVAVWSKGKVNICGGTFIGGDKLSEHAILDTSTCPQPQSTEQPKAAEEPKTQAAQPVAEEPKTSTTKTTATKQSKTTTTIAAEDVVINTPETDINPAHTVEDNSTTPTEEPKTTETQPEEKKNDNTIAVLLASLVLFAGASAAILITKKH